MGSGGLTQDKRYWWLATAFLTAVVTAVVAGLLLGTQSAGADGSVVAGNKNCIDLIPDSRELRIDAPADGTFNSTNGDGFSVTIDVRTLANDSETGDHPGDQTGNEVFDFTASGGVVIGAAVKGGPNTNFYDYRPGGVTSDTGLHAPLNTDNNKFFDLSHISFCYRIPEPEGPPGDETCSDGIDNDLDGLTDLDDPDCQEPEGPPGDPTCSDGIDNDNDGLTDLDDPDCQEPEGPPGDPTCSDGIDNDNDGLTDLDDPDCQEPPAPQCSDNVDNVDPEDTLVDEDDPGCHSDGDPDNPDSYVPTDDDETNTGEGPPGDPTCSDGIDNDGDGLIDQADPDCQEPEGPPGDPTCSDGIDNDGDGLTDLDDPDCQEQPAPECSDNVDNTDPEDNLVDEDDPGCHSDGDPDNPDSYVPTDDDETNTGEGPPGDPTCSDGIDNDGDGLIDEDDPDCQVGPGDARFTCRASALRIDDSPLEPLIGNPFEPLVANANGDPCEDEDASLVNEMVGGEPGDPGSLTVQVLHATTSDDSGADASGGVANVVIRDELGVTVLRVGVLNAAATGRCEGGQPVLDGSSEVVGVEVGPLEVDVTIPPDDPATPADESHVEVPLGPLGTIHLNEEIVDPDAATDSVTLTRRALWFEGSPLGDIIVGEAVADVHGDPC